MRYSCRNRPTGFPIWGTGSHAVRLDKSSRNLLETTPACHCFEKNAETERQSLAEYLAESVVTVTGRRWSYGDGHTYCTLDVEVRN